MADEAAELIAVYRALIGLYRRQAEELAALAPDADRVAELMAASGELVAGLPDPAGIALTAAAATELADLARQADEVRTAVAARVADLGEEQLARLRAQHRRDAVVRAYRQSSNAGPRFVDKAR